MLVSVVALAGLPLACAARGPETPQPLAIQIASARPPPPSAAPPTRKRREVRRVAPDVYEVPASLFRRLLRDRGAVDRRVWVEPATEDGKLVGYRLQGIRADSVIAQLGLQNDDLVELINGTSPESPAALDEAQAYSERTGQITLLLTRLGYSRIMQYQINDD